MTTNNSISVKPHWRSTGLLEDADFITQNLSQVFQFFNRIKTGLRACLKLPAMRWHPDFSAMFSMATFFRRTGSHGSTSSKMADATVFKQAISFSSERKFQSDKKTGPQPGLIFDPRRQIHAEELKRDAAMSRVPREAATARGGRRANFHPLYSLAGPHFLA